ncbi:hypothetical protein SAMN05428995_102348 [Loktanella sp. DSM 29012]|uniref:Uncharacterized protein n=1 Tax=Loktanella gaetbuli TaxID=2881335 RepID=A0ABS8BV81_9RHOB|nr:MULTISPECIES: hypothetical protein [Loktanella]MCB5199624.1 hypothetical protein [Loktanella gaetbuli]SEQ02510.1 hypothetical protein SAMN05428995_102348 [Loktanella sp. DSM 29012]
MRYPMTLLLAFAPGPALAQVCAQMRPDWSGGPVSAMTEAIWLFSTAPTVALLIATGAAIWFRSTWAGAAAVVAWSGYIYLLSSDVQILSQARAEGCIGPQTLSIGIVIAICVTTVLITAPRKPRSE